MQSGLSQHKKYGHCETRNAARASVSARSSQLAPRRRIFNEENLMLQLEVRLRGERCVAQRMMEFLPAKTNKQIRDKRDRTSYRNRLREVLRQDDTRHDIMNRAEDQNEEDDVFREANVQPASPVEEQRRQPRYNLRNRPHLMEGQETESDAPEMPEALPAAHVATARRSEGEQPCAALEALRVINWMTMHLTNLLASLRS